MEKDNIDGRFSTINFLEYGIIILWEKEIIKEIEVVL